LAARTRIGVPFNYDENWVGGAYYVKNVISSLNLLPSHEQPDIVIISHTQASFDFIRNSTRYPRLTWIKAANLDAAAASRLVGIADRHAPLLRNLPLPFRRVLRRIHQVIVRALARSKGKPLTFDVVLPYPCDGFESRTICWIPDFQEKHLPEFFSEADRTMRDDQHKLYFANFNWIIFSSRSALDDFRRFYPGQTIEPHVVPFAVFNDEVDRDARALKQRLGLPERFFYSPNQFWIHKNHAVILDALVVLRARGLKPFLAFSGKEFDSRAPGHTEALKRRVIEEGLQDQVSFLGFLPRDQQLTLLAGAIAIIQPSLSEGWSTVIEDAKSLGQFVVASDLPVHREQLQDNRDFFPPRDPLALADLMARYVETDPIKRPIDYDTCREAFAREIMALATKVSQSGR
jgi:glycosyltransferase involved in cell wall biosynthesis